MTEQWFRVITRGPGREAQHVLCDPAQMATLYPLADYYPARALDREPSEADVFRARKVQRSDEVAARIAEEAALNRMTRAELLDEVLRRVREAKA